MVKSKHFHTKKHNFKVALVSYDKQNLTFMLLNLSNLMLKNYKMLGKPHILSHFPQLIQLFQ